MDWTRAIDGYCERLDAGFWAEPVNAVTNAAFLIAALLVWRLTFGLGRVLAAVLFVIGVGSFLFHTFAQPWAALADVLPILLFILIYVFAASRDFLRLPLWGAVGVTVAYVPYSAALTPLFGLIPNIGGSAAYAPVPLLIAVYAVILRKRAPVTARGLAIGAALLVVSLTARTVDLPLCATLPLGTHFLWHILNAVMLGWMILVWTGHQRRSGLVTAASEG